MIHATSADPLSIISMADSVEQERQELADGAWRCVLDHTETLDSFGNLYILIYRRQTLFHAVSHTRIM